MKFVVPMSPHTAARANFNGETGRVSRTYMDQGYRKWRDQFNNWFIDYLNHTDNALLNYLTSMSDGRPIRNEATTQLIPDFNGYLVRIIFVLKRPKNSKRTFPVASNTADLDNLYKAITDGIFESEPARYVGLNDRWIQTLQTSKRYTALNTAEQPHIEVEIKRIEV